MQCLFNKSKSKSIMATKEKNQSVFATLNAINVNDHVEKKSNGKVELTYLSWAWAWAEVKKAYPDATYTIYENSEGWNYHTDGRTCWVKTGVTIEGLEHIEYLPVMNNRNASIIASEVTSFDVNKAIQRSLTKAAARHGLGLYIYAGEDLPEGVVDTMLEKALAQVRDCVSRAELQAVWNENKDLQKDGRFIEAVKSAGATMEG